MRRAIGALIAVTAAAVGVPIAIPNAARADTSCAEVDPATGTCVVSVTGPSGSGSSAPTNPGRSNTGTGAACYWDPSIDHFTTPPAGPVPCTSQYGYWSNSEQCYITLDRPQPPAGDVTWQGHQPGDGAVYVCYQPQSDMGIFFWAKVPPPASGAGPTPRGVAQIAIQRMNLSAINIGLAPKPGAGSVGLVGMPVWMWASSPTAQTTGPVTEAASAGGLTITATARLQRVTWSMGDGTNVVCRGAGTPYVPADGRGPSPDCGHTYLSSSSNQPGGTFTVTATSDWVVTWSGAGQSGTIQLPGLSRSTQIEVGEAQVLVQ